MVYAFVLVAVIGSTAEVASTVSVTNSNGNWTIDALLPFDKAVARDVIWSVLTDYDHLSDFISSMQESRVVEQPPSGDLIVSQLAIGKVFLFSSRMHVMLLIHEYAGVALTFIDLSHDDFFHYQGTWTIRDDTNGRIVHYHLQATPRVQAPVFLLTPALEIDAKAMLGDIAAEILKRENKQRAP